MSFVFALATGLLVTIGLSTHSAGSRHWALGMSAALALYSIIYAIKEKR